MRNKVNRKKGEPLSNLSQELFCQNYALKGEFFGNGTQAYIDAYNIDTNKSGAYQTARAQASILLTKTNILERIDEILEDWGFNNQHMDKQLWLAATQNADMGAKVSAITQYNKLKQRISDKLELHGKIDLITAINEAAGQATRDSQPDA